MKGEEAERRGRRDVGADQSNGRPVHEGAAGGAGCGTSLIASATARRPHPVASLTQLADCLFVLHRRPVFLPLSRASPSAPGTGGSIPIAAKSPHLNRMCLPAPRIRLADSGAQPIVLLSRRDYSRVEILLERQKRCDNQRLCLLKPRFCNSKVEIRTALKPWRGTLSEATHVLCEKQEKINETYKKLQDEWGDNGDKVPPAEFAKESIQFIRYRATSRSVSARYERESSPTLRSFQKLEEQI